MGIPFALETWSLTLWNECQPLPWLDERLLNLGNQKAEIAYPNEVCGFFIKDGTQIFLHTFTGASGPTWCSASPDEVIQFAYWTTDRSSTILASFHTHPDGATRPSELDHLFSMWTKTHLIWIRLGPSWGFRVFHS